MKRRILCLRLPEWAIQRVLGEREIQNAEFRIQNSKKATVNSTFSILHSELPILLHARDPRRGDLIVACNEAARARGVRLGMPLAEAEALAQHGGGECRIEPHDPGTDLAELARLSERCERFSPIVGWNTVESRKSGTVEGRKSKVESRESSNLRHSTFDIRLGCAPDCLFLDVTGIGVLFGGEEHLGREVVMDVARQGYDCRVAIGDTIGITWAALSQEDSPVVQILSTEYSVLSGQSWPVESLRLPLETIDLLGQLGIHRLADLLELPRESLRARFGERLLLRIDQLVGTAQEMIVPHRPPPRFAEEWAFEVPAERREAVEHIVRELVHRIADALAARREGVLKLACRLDCAPGRPLRFEVGLFRPSADEVHLWDLVRMQLEQAALPGPVGRVRLEAMLTAPLENRQGELFAGGRQESERQLALLIDRYSSRLGSSAVLRPQVTADPLPERAVRYRAGVWRGRSAERGARNKGKSKITASHSAVRIPHSALLRPLFLSTLPQPLEVLSIAPDGPPISIQMHGQQCQVAAREGPERIETGWWRGKTIRRDYWRVEITTGQRFWLFRSLSDGQWHLHGEYA